MTYVQHMWLAHKHVCFILIPGFRDETALEVYERPPYYQHGGWSWTGGPGGARGGYLGPEGLDEGHYGWVSEEQRLVQVHHLVWRPGAPRGHLILPPGLRGAGTGSQESLLVLLLLLL